MTSFGKGHVLRDACSHLCDQKRRLRCIVEVTRRDSIIEELPDIHPADQEKLIQKLATLS